MELKMEIGLDQLIQAIRNLPAMQFARLKAEINNVTPEKTDKESFKAFLLQAPTFTDEQITLIEEARKNINKWRKD
jgi:hypothetical protein